MSNQLYSTPSMFYKKSIAVVGNAASILEHEDGEWIDSFDHVVRFNCNMPTEDNSKSLGSKTTDMFGALQGFRVARRKKRLPDILKTVELAACRQPCDWVPWHFPQDINFELQDQYGAEPTTGAIALQWFIEHTLPQSIVCFGFDFLKTKPFYRDGNTHTARHDPTAEFRMAMAFKNCGVKYPRVYV